MERYRRLVESVDEFAGRLFARYRPELHCRRGCYFCCDEIVVRPVELESLRRHIVSYGSPEAKMPAARKRCAFLGVDGACTVYDHRPVICRTHGLPLSYRVTEYGPDGAPNFRATSERADTWCDLNFQNLPDGAAGSFFDRHGRIDMSAIDEELDRLNDAFVASPEGTRYRGTGRRPLRWLLEESR